jgi:2-iminobutanoate/2-iminopropanoate deaminase
MRLRVVLPAMALSMLVAGEGTAAKLCANASGSVFVRDACKGNEQVLDPVALGLVGPPGPPGVGCAGDPKVVVSTPDAPAAIGPYSQAIKICARETMYVAGQLPLDPITNAIVGADIVTQTHQVMLNLLAVLEAGGMSINDVVMSHVYLSDLNNFAAFNAIYATYFGSAPPARATVQVARIPRDALIEIAMIAATPPTSSN